MVTSAEGAKKLQGLPTGCEVLVAGEGTDIDLARALDQLHGRGYNVILTEGGPSLMGHLIRARLLDEMFLTLSPVIAGRAREKRLGMLEGLELLPAAGLWTRMLSARRHGEYMFLRYGLSTT